MVDWVMRGFRAPRAAMAASVDPYTVVCITAWLSRGRRCAPRQWHATGRAAGAYGRTAAWADAGGVDHGSRGDVRFVERLERGGDALRDTRAHTGNPPGTGMCRGSGSRAEGCPAAGAAGRRVGIPYGVTTIPAPRTVTPFLARGRVWDCSINR